MDYLEDFRGIKEAAVSGMSPSASNDRLAQLMLAPIQQVDEIITRSGIYRRRGDRASDLGHFEKAMEIFLWGLQNLLRSQKVLTARSPDTNPANVKKQLLRKKMELILSYSVLYKREGLGHFSDHCFDWVLEDTADLTGNEEANAYYKVRTFRSDFFLFGTQIRVARYIREARGSLYSSDLFQKSNPWLEEAMLTPRSA